MIGPKALMWSRAYVAGMRAGYRRAGRSFFRRFFLQIILTVTLFGAGLGFLWSAADLFFRLRSDEPVQKVILGKWGAWNKVYHPARGQSR